MAEMTFTHFKDVFRCGYGRLPTLEETWKAAKRAGALKPSYNKQSTPIKCKCGGTLKEAVMCDNCYEATFGDGT